MNVDLNPDVADVPADIKALPFPDDYADAIVAIHVVEHIYRWEVLDMFKEWLRVLKPGGKVIVELPSMEKVFKYIMDSFDRKEAMSPTFSWFPLWGDPKYREPGMVHRWGYTYPMLKEILIKAGFTGVMAEKPRYHFPNRDMRITAVKPSSNT